MKALKLFLIFNLLVCCDEQDRICSPFTPKPSDKYHFPVRPGMPAWSEFTSGQQMIDACQVPELILENMSTYGLIETCLDYPLLNNMLAFDNVQLGTEKQMENFNGFSELILRDNATLLMLERYKLMNPMCPPKSNDLTVGEYGLHFIYFSMIQSQVVLLHQLVSSERRELLEEAVIKYDFFLQDQINYGIFNLKTTALIIARVMVVEGYKPFLNEMDQNESLRIFVNDVDLQNNLGTLKIILDYGNEF